MTHRRLGLYIHWPFCISKCPYCDFNSFVGNTMDAASFAAAYHAQMQAFFERTSDHTLHTVFFGGGTPSLMPPALTESLIDQALRLWRCDEDIEITLEANPNTMDHAKFLDFKHAGINRLSLGVQSFDDQALSFLGRNHSAAEAIAAIETALKTYDRMTFDLIYARPGQTLNAWEDELSYALSFGTSHLSLYQLTIEPGTAFAPRYDRGEIILPKDELAADLYTLTRDVTARHGLSDYEVSNYAKPGQESQHNLIYWRYDDYVGIGPGAHGRFMQDQEKIATVQHKAPTPWMEGVLQNKDHGRCTVITPAQQEHERWMMGLRLHEGIVLRTNTLPLKMQELIKHGYMHSIKDGSLMRVYVNHEGRLRLNSILGYLNNDEAS